MSELLAAIHGPITSDRQLVTLGGLCDAARAACRDPDEASALASRVPITQLFECIAALCHRAGRYYAPSRPRVDRACSDFACLKAATSATLLARNMCMAGPAVQLALCGAAGGLGADAHDGPACDPPPAPDTLIGVADRVAGNPFLASGAGEGFLEAASAALRALTQACCNMLAGCEPARAAAWPAAAGLSLSLLRLPLSLRDDRLSAVACSLAQASCCGEGGRARLRAALSDGALLAAMLDASRPKAASPDTAELPQAAQWVFLLVAAAVEAGCLGAGVAALSEALSDTVASDGAPGDAGSAPAAAEGQPSPGPASAGVSPAGGGAAPGEGAGAAHESRPAAQGSAAPAGSLSADGGRGLGDDAGLGAGAGLGDDAGLGEGASRLRSLERSRAAVQRCLLLLRLARDATATQPDGRAGAAVVEAGDADAVAGFAADALEGFLRGAGECPSAVAHTLSPDCGDDSLDVGRWEAALATTACLQAEAALAALDLAGDAFEAEHRRSEATGAERGAAGGTAEGAAWAVAGPGLRSALRASSVALTCLPVPVKARSDREAAATGFEEEEEEGGGSMAADETASAAGGAASAAPASAVDRGQAAPAGPGAVEAAPESGFGDGRTQDTTKAAAGAGGGGEDLDSGPGAGGVRPAPRVGVRPRVAEPAVAPVAKTVAQHLHGVQQAWDRGGGDLLRVRKSALALDLRAAATRLAANALHKNAPASDEAADCGLLGALLGQTRMEHGVARPVIREFALLAIRNACACSDGARAYVAKLQPKAVADPEAMRAMGIRATVEEASGRVSVGIEPGQRRWRTTGGDASSGAAASASASSGSSVAEDAVRRAMADGEVEI